MGRLNYTNRKIEGLKLGQVIAKDLTKRVPPGTGSKAAFRDPVVDLDVSGRVLTSEGFVEVAAALVKGIGYDSEHGKVVKLEELCLRDNKLDAKCLQALGKVIKVAAGDLRDLDLSDNLFSITTCEEVAAWEDFLNSFSACCVLRRIDLSGNAIGPRAFEILAKTYGQEPLINVLSLEDAGIDRQHDVYVLENTTSDRISLEHRAKTLRIIESSESRSNDGNSSSHATSEVQKGSRHDSLLVEKARQGTPQTDVQSFYASTCGLRSVPYLILSSTAMTDTCALHLSHIITSHNVPEQLLTRVPPAKAGPPAQQLLAYDEESRCQGIIYFPNKDVGNAGLKVLELAETLRMNLLEELAHEGATTPSLPQNEFEVSNTARRPSEASVSSMTSASPNRRRSKTSTTNSQRGARDNARITRLELDRARHRVQGDTLRDARPLCNDLWQTSLKMLSLSRMICLMPRQERPQIPVRPLERAKSSTSPERSPTKTTHSDDDSNFPALPNPLTKPLRSLTASAPLAPANPNQSLSRRLHQHRKDSTNPMTLIPIIPPLAAAPTANPTPPARSKLSRTDSYRSSLPLGFSFQVWRKIIAASAGADGIISEAQQRSVLRWGMDKGTLSRERESLGLPEYTQIWKVLEGMGCLAYEVNC